jgi:hypothetical protein
MTAGRKNQSKQVKQSKTETSKERCIWVYLPSFEMLNQWNEMAKNTQMSLSKFVIEHVNNSLQQEQNKEGYSSRAELLDDMKKLQDENKDLYKKIKMYESLVMKLEEENRGYRTKPFLEDNYDVDREFEKDLVTLFITRNEVRKEDIYEHLGIKTRDADKVKAIKKQIEILERYGLLKDIGGKWRWKG